MCREHRPHLESSHDLGEHLRLDSGLEDAVDGGCQTELVDAQLIDSVDLFGNVRQVEVGGERPDQRDHLVDLQVGEPPVELAGGLGAPASAGGFAQSPDLFDEIE